MSSPYPAGGPPSGVPGGKTSLGLESNVGAMLCYIGNFLCCLGLVLAIVFLITEKENRFVKFHAVQSLFLALTQIALSIVMGILTQILAIVLGMIHLGFLAFFLNWGLGLIIFVVFAIVWIFAGIKAYGSQWYKLPFIGEFAWNIVDKP
jgi:uncharacterized membrane protein